MAENSSIQWTDHTFNPWIGCAKVHTGCLACYAEDLMANRYKRVEWGPQGTRVRTKTWDDPVRWNKEAERTGKRFKVFCASLADVFEDRADLVEWRRDLFRLIDQCQHLDFLLLTKRPENVPNMWYTKEQGGMGQTMLTRKPFRRDNVWLGTSISDQETADKWGKQLVNNRAYARVLFFSMEPQIGPVDLGPLLALGKIDWVIVGGESKQGKHDPRVFDIDWAEAAVHQCCLHGVPCFVKQLGSEVRHNGIPVSFKDKHAGEIDKWPAAVRVREFPR